MAAAVAVLLVCSLAANFVNNIINMNLRQTVLTEQLGQLKLEVQSIEDLQSDAEKIERFSVVIKNIKKEDASKLKLLEELTGLIPEDSWLTEFRYTAKEKKIKLSGYAVSASKLIPILEESQLFENVRFTSPITTEKGRNKERFRLEMTVSTG